MMPEDRGDAEDSGDDASAGGACINSMSAAPWAVEHSTKLITQHEIDQGFVIPVFNSGGREGDSGRRPMGIIVM